MPRRSNRLYSNSKVLLLYVTTLSAGLTLAAAYLGGCNPSAVRTNKNDHGIFSIPYRLVTQMLHATEKSDNADTRVATPVQKRSTRWDSIHPRHRERIIREGQERAIANKKKRESDDDRKRRMLMFVKEKQLDKKRASRVKRPVKFKDRTPLANLTPGMELPGTVISLTKFGAYVDVGTECDGLLHISQMSRTQFIEHPKQFVVPGDKITVRVRSTSPEKKKLHLTMFSKEELEAEREDDGEERISLQEIQTDDELWGQIKRVTNFGAYVEVGAVVDGFLHFMDHPDFMSSGVPEHPKDFMKVGDRVRVWAVSVDLEQNRLKLTANRPWNLPGPRRGL